MLLALLPLAFAKNDLQELTSAFQLWSSKLGGQLVVGTTGPQAYKLALRVQKLDNALPMHIQPLPVVGSIDKELVKAMRTHRSRCGLHLEIVKEQWIITPFGECQDEERVLKISEDGELWRIKDDKGRLVTAMSYSIMVGDQDLQELLREEQSESLARQRALALGSGLTALASFMPLVQMEPGLPPSSVDRLWTSVFLLSSSGMLMAAKNYPPRALREQQVRLENYMTLEMAEERINRRWPPPEPENPEEEPPSLPAGESGDEALLGLPNGDDELPEKQEGEEPPNEEEAEVSAESGVKEPPPESSPTPQPDEAVPPAQTPPTGEGP